MDLELYQDIALTCDFSEYQLKQGDIGMSCPYRNVDNFVIDNSNKK